MYFISYLTQHWVSLVILLVLAIIPSVIASKKYYNATFFYIYGVVAFIPALIHVLMLPDMSKGGVRKIPTSAVAFAGLDTIFMFYAFVLSFTSRYLITLRGGYSSISGGIFYVVSDWISIGLTIWLIVCLFRCNTGKPLMLNFIISGVISIIRIVVGTALEVGRVFGAATSSHPFGEIIGTFFKRLRMYAPSLIWGVGMMISYIVLAVFLNRLNNKKSVEPKLLYCLSPVALCLISSFAAMMVGGIDKNTIPLDYPNTTTSLIIFLFLGLYIYAMSLVPSVPEANGEETVNGSINY